ncbi:MAG TPA: hypothetical protein GX708_13880 [Gallicola sp.]|nr:hypothetical protein [Gallicola sp.]
MQELIVDFKIKNYSVKVIRNSVIIYKNDDLLFQANYDQIRLVLRWVISKVNELKDSPEVKTLEK